MILTLVTIGVRKGSLIDIKRTFYGSKISNNENCINLQTHINAHTKYENKKG